MTINRPLPRRPNLPPPASQPNTAAPLPRNRVQFGKPIPSGHRVLLYGPGGIGKTTLASFAPGPVAFFDLEESLSKLTTLGDLNVVDGIKDWAALRAALQSDGWDETKTIVIDSLTRAEELCVAHTLANIKHEKGNTVDSIEGYGYGKGYQHVFETFLPILGDLDRHTRAGRNIILICHDCTATVPNPAGEDWLRYEPRLQSPTSGKAAIRLRVKEWADHVLFFGYDVDVTKEGKGRGSGTRTIYTAELPHCMAKSRTTSATIPLGEDLASVWSTIIN